MACRPIWWWATLTLWVVGPTTPTWCSSRLPRMTPIWSTPCGRVWTGVLLGGVGGRLEHTLANLQALAWLTTQGARGVLAGEGTVATALRNETMTFPAGLTGFWSAFCLSGQAEGVTLRNLKFELTGHTLSADFPLGVSNEFTGEAAEVSVARGTLLAMWREQGDFYRLLPQLWDRTEIQHEGE